MNTERENGGLFALTPREAEYITVWAEQAHQIYPLTVSERAFFDRVWEWRRQHTPKGAA